jgi:hypothetical protein
VKDLESEQLKLTAELDQLTDILEERRAENVTLKSDAEGL